MTEPWKKWAQFRENHQPLGIWSLEQALGGKRRVTKYQQIWGWGCTVRVEVRKRSLRGLFYKVGLHIVLSASVSLVAWEKPEKLRLSYLSHIGHRAQHRLYNMVFRKWGGVGGKNKEVRKRNWWEKQKEELNRWAFYTGQKNGLQSWAINLKILAFYFQKKKEDEKKEARKRGMRKGIRNLHSVKLAHISVSVIFFFINFPYLIHVCSLVQLN